MQDHLRGDHASTATTTEGEPFDFAEAIARSERRQAALAALTPEQARARARMYEDEHKHYLRLSAAKRRKGYGDCSRELAAARRLALGRLTPVLAAGHSNVVIFPSPRERRNRAGRSSARSGDSGSDDSGSEPPAADRWRWASEASWRSFITSTEARDFEHEVHLERWHGVRS